MNQPSTTTPASRATRIGGSQDISRIEAAPYADYLPFTSVLDGLEHAARAFPDRHALSFIQDADLSIPALRWTYTEFVQAVRSAACLFQQLAGDQPARVAMLLPAIPQAYFTLWGAETAGMVCPINYLLNSEQIADLLRVADVNILVALGPHPDLDIWSKVDGLKASCPGLRHVLAVGGAPGATDFDERLAQSVSASASATFRAGVDQPAALFHTGGTTGKPKLAQHTHGNQLHAAWGAAHMYGSNEHDVMLNGFPLFHVAGSMVYGLSTLLTGGEVVLPTLLGLRNTGFMDKYWNFVEREGVTFLAGVPTIIARLVKQPVDGVDLGKVRAFLTGGSPLPIELANALEQHAGIDVRNILGMTECAGVIAIEPVASARVAGSVGLPLPFTRVRVVAPDGELLPTGASGILQIQGPNVSPGYTDAQRNQGVFLAQGWLDTGDIGHVDADGRVYVTGRAKDVIIRSSHNIDPMVIEDALMQHPDVQLAAAVGAPDEYAGEIPVAFVTLKAGATFSQEALSSFANRLIHERPAYPKWITLLNEIPVTAVGKVYKPSLKNLAIEQVLTDRVTRAGLAGQVDVAASEDAQRAGVTFTLRAGAAHAEITQTLQDIMRPFALVYRIDTPQTAAIEAA